MSTESATDFARVIFPDIQPAERSRKEDRGYVQGHAAGYAAGIQAAALEQQRLREQLQAEHRAMLDAGRQAVANAVRALEATAVAARQHRGVALEEAQDVLAACAIELAEAILGYELDNGQNTARAALTRALGAVSGVETVTAIRLHPADLAALAAVDVGSVAGVEIKADPGLNPGDAIAEYPQGWLDARLSTALDRAKAALLGNDA